MEGFAQEPQSPAPWQTPEALRLQSFNRSTDPRGLLAWRDVRRTLWTPERRAETDAIDQLNQQARLS